MTRIDDRVRRRESARKRTARAALSVALGFSMLVGAEAAQYDYPAQVDAQRQYQAAQRQGTQSRSNGASSSRTPIISGFFNNQGGSPQSSEPQRVGLLGGKPLLPSLRGSSDPKPQAFSFSISAGTTTLAVWVAFSLSARAASASRSDL